MEPNGCEKTYITVARKLVLKATREKPVLGSTQAAGLTKVVFYGNVTIRDACMTSEGTTYSYQNRSSHITTLNVSEVYVNLHKHLKVDEAGSVTQEIVRTKYKHFLYRSDAKATNDARSVKAVHYKTTTGHLIQMADLEAVKDKDERIRKKNWRNDVQLPAK